VVAPCPSCGAAPHAAARFCATCGARLPSPPAVAVELDAVTLDDARAGEQLLVRVRARNDGGDPVDLALSARSTAGAARVVGGAGTLAPGRTLAAQVLLRPEVAGHHTLAVGVTAQPAAGAPAAFHTDDVAFRVGAAGALAQSITIDARQNRVGVFENIGNAERGGLVGEARWRAVSVRPGALPAEAPVVGPTLPEPGARVTGVVTAGGDVPALDVDGVPGALVELEDPALRAVLARGDRLQVTVLGHDGRGGLLLSTRAPRAAPTAAPTGRVGPGDSLADAIAAAPAGARLQVTGTHQGPFVVARPLELWGDGVLQAAKGPVLALAADAVVRGLTIRGAAGPGAYAADAVEVRAGRVLLERCALSAEAPGNLTPGRVVAVTGPATLELRDCTVTDAALGLAVDVSWAGSATDTAAGATVTVAGGRFERVGTALAAAGPRRTVTATGADLRGATDAATHAQRGATVTLRDCLTKPGAT
jgi:hypothetical protein